VNVAPSRRASTAHVTLQQETSDAQLLTISVSAWARPLDFPATVSTVLRASGLPVVTALQFRGAGNGGRSVMTTSRKLSPCHLSDTALVLLGRAADSQNKMLLPIPWTMRARGKATGARRGPSAARPWIEFTPSRRTGRSRTRRYREALGQAAGRYAVRAPPRDGSAAAARSVRRHAAGR
jgi:hypothetical protein